MYMHAGLNIVVWLQPAAAFMLVYLCLLVLVATFLLHPILMISHFHPVLSCPIINVLASLSSAVLSVLILCVVGHPSVV